MRPVVKISSDEHPFVLTVVGLPLTNDTMTKEFVDYVNQENLVLVMCCGFNLRDPDSSDEYAKAKVGYDYLKERFAYVSYKNYRGEPNRVVMLHDAWIDQDNKRASGLEVANKIEKYISEIRSENYQYGFITCGSPYVGDYVVKNLNCTRVIDTKSSMDICADWFVERGYDKPIYHLEDYYDYDLQDNSINILSRMGETYMAGNQSTAKLRTTFPTNLENLFEKLTDSMEIYSFHFGPTSEVIKYTTEEIKRKLTEDRSFFNPRLLVLVT